MANTVQYFLRGIQLPSTNWITQLDDLDPAMSSQLASFAVAGGIHPSFLGGFGARPAWTFQTTQVKAILDLCGFWGVDLSAGNVDLYYQSGVNLGSRTAISSLAHLRFRALRCFLYWTNIRASQGSPATISCRLVPTFDGTNVPVVATGSLAIPAETVFSSLYSLGPVKLNGTALSGVQDWSLDLNPNIIERSDSGEDFTTYIGCAAQTPVFNVTLDDIGSWTPSIGVSGLAVTALLAYLRKRVLGTIRHVADATAEHISFAGTDNPCGVATIGRTGGGAASAASPASQTLQVNLRANTTTATHVLAMATAVAVT